MPIRWRFGDPYWEEHERLQRNFSELLNNLSGTRRAASSPLWGEARLFPLLNVYEAEDSYVISAEIPGMKTEDLEIKVDGDTLSLKGERKPFDASENASYHRRERASGAFQRSMTLPGRVDADQVKATYKNGVLTVTAPKEKSALPKQISIDTE